MPSGLNENIKDHVRRLWFSGETRNNIAAECQIGAGSVTNIVKEWTKGVEESDLEEIRELVVQLKKEGMTLSEFASIYRCHHYVKKLGASEEQIESLIVNMLDATKSIPPEKIAELLNQLFEISKSESIVPIEVHEYVTQKIEEKKRVEVEIQKAGATLQNKNVDIQTIDEYKALKDELKKYGLSTVTPCRLISVLRMIDQIEYDPRKIVSELTRVKTLQQTERRLKSNCKMWEWRANQYKEIVPMCKRVISGGIGFPLLLALETAAIKRTEEDGIPAGAAPFRIMQDIDDYNRHGGMKKQLYDTLMQINMTKEFLGRQKDAINTFMKLRLNGWTDDQILKSCKIIEENGDNLSPLHY